MLVSQCPLPPAKFEFIQVQDILFQFIVYDPFIQIKIFIHKMEDAHWKCQVCWTSKLVPMWSVDSGKCIECKHVYCDSCKEAYFKAIKHVPIWNKFSCVQCKARGSKLVKIFPPPPLANAKRTLRLIARDEKKKKDENCVGGVSVPKKVRFHNIC
jgi:hypothetical protein